MVKASSLEELFEYASKVLSGEEEYQPVEIDADSMPFSITVHGEGWNRRMDPRHARYILSLQDTLDDLINEHAPDIREEDRPLVRAELNEGSSNIVPDVLEFAKGLVTPMTPEHTFYSVVTALACATGYMMWTRWLSHKSDTAQLEEHEETKRQLLEPLRAYAETNKEKLAPMERPVRALVSNMEPEDEIAVAAGGLMPRKEASKAIPRRPRSRKSVTYCDGEYLLEEIHYSLGELILKLSQGGRQLKAYTSALSNDEMRELSQVIAERQVTEDLPFPLSLQVNVEHTAREIKHGMVVGFGEPRPDKEHTAFSLLLA